MSIDDFFDKANSVYRAAEKFLKKTVDTQQDQFRRRLRSSSDEQLRAMEKKLSEEGRSPVLESMLYEEMRRRHMT